MEVKTPRTRESRVLSHAAHADLGRGPWPSDARGGSGTAAAGAAGAAAAADRVAPGGDDARTAPRRVRLKCYHGGEIRIVGLDERTSVRNLLDRLETDYGFPVTVRYIDEDGELITLATQNDLRELLYMNQSTVKAQVVPNTSAEDVAAYMAEPTPPASAALHPLADRPAPMHQTSPSEDDGSITPGPVPASSSRAPPLQIDAPLADTGARSPVMPTPQATGSATHVHGSSTPSVHPLGTTLPSAGVHMLRRGSADASHTPGLGRPTTGANDRTGYISGMADRPADPSCPGHKDFKWQKGHLLGQGAFGAVYLGLNLFSGEMMAVKQLDTNEVSARELAALQHEIQLLQGMQHPNIVRYIGTERAGDTLSIFLEYVPGGSIRQILSRFGKLDEGIVRSYTRQLLLGLEYLHQNGIAHRDVKGGNVLLDNDGTIKLADFGASKRISQASTAGSAGGTGGNLKGTPMWMAPEVIREQQTAKGWKKADIWSVGCTVLEMLTGQPPWSEFTNAVTAMYHIACVESVPAFPPNISEACADFLRLCFKRDPAQRPDVTLLLLHSWVAHSVHGIRRAPSAFGSRAGQVRPSTADHDGWRSRSSALGSPAVVAELPDASNLWGMPVLNQSLGRAAIAGGPADGAGAGHATSGITLEKPGTRAASAAIASRATGNARAKQPRVTSARPAMTRAPTSSAAAAVMRGRTASLESVHSEEEMGLSSIDDDAMVALMQGAPTAAQHMWRSQNVIDSVRGLPSPATSERTAPAVGDMSHSRSGPPASPTGMPSTAAAAAAATQRSPQTSPVHMSSANHSDASSPTMLQPVILPGTAGMSGPRASGAPSSNSSQVQGDSPRAVRMAPSVDTSATAKSRRAARNRTAKSAGARAQRAAAAGQRVSPVRPAQPKGRLVRTHSEHGGMSSHDTDTDDRSQRSGASSNRRSYSAMRSAPHRGRALKQASPPNVNTGTTRSTPRRNRGYVQRPNGDGSPMQQQQQQQRSSRRAGPGGPPQPVREPDTSARRSPRAASRPSRPKPSVGSPTAQLTNRSHSPMQVRSSALADLLDAVKGSAPRADARWQGGEFDDEVDEDIHFDGDVVGVGMRMQPRPEHSTPRGQQHNGAARSGACSARGRSFAGSPVLTTHADRVEASPVPGLIGARLPHGQPLHGLGPARKMPGRHHQQAQHLPGVVHKLEAVRMSGGHGSKNASMRATAPVTARERSPELLSNDGVGALSSPNLAAYARAAHKVERTTHWHVPELSEGIPPTRLPRPATRVSGEHSPRALHLTVHPSGPDDVYGHPALHTEL